VTDRVYYNSACPVCRAGIADQKARMEACGATDVEWVDVHQAPERAAEVDAGLEEVREKLHVRRADGTVAVGAEAFGHLWSATSGQTWMGRLVRLPVLSTLARWGYNGFARLLYLWNRAKRRW
jgi:predicted DCC family thiol-disulfide oxidoreductase YuxK